MSEIPSSLSVFRIGTDMRTRTSAALIAAVLLAAVACNRIKPTTIVSGEVLSGVETVYVISPAAALDTAVVAQDGRFEVEIPSCVTALVSVECGADILQFVADGSDITVDFQEGKVFSSKKKGIQSRFNELVDTFVNFTDEYKNGIQEIYSDETITQEERAGKAEEYSNGKISEIKDVLETVIRKNPDNIVGVQAFLQASMLADNDLEIKSYLDLLGPEVLELEQVKATAAALAVREGSGEGCMFTDFAVNSVVGFNADGSQIVKPVCLSDYVGQGKYMLVDFWASWCGPCRAEIPNIIDVYENFAGDRFDVLSIAVWDEPEKSFEAAQEEGVCWNQIVCTVEDRAIPTEKYGIEGIPQIMLFAPDGTIVARGLRGEAIAAKVAEVLGL